MKSAKADTLNPFLLLLAAFVLIACTWAQFIGGYIGDKGWLYTASGMFLDGKRLFVDIFEVNPPLIVWLYSLPVYVSRLLAIEDYHALVAFTLLLVGLSTVLCWQLIRAHPECKERPAQRGYFALFIAVMFICFNVNYFGDREHLFTVLSLPYFIRFMPSLAHQRYSMPMRVIIGASAAIGFCIKPHFLLVFALLQLIILLQQRTLAFLFRAENLVIYATGIAYGISVYHFAPEYFSVVLPMALAAYGDYNPAGKTGLIGYFLWHAITLAVAFSEFRPTQRSPYRRDILYYLGICAADTAYALINAGWGYTLVPLYISAFITIALLSWEFAWLARNATPGTSSKRFVFGQRACRMAIGFNLATNLFLASLVIPAVVTMVFPDTSKFSESEQCDTWFGQQLSGTKTFGVISENFGQWPRLVRQENAHLGTRFHFIWMLRKFDKSGSEFKTQHQWILDYLGHAMASDIISNKPEVVFVELDGSTSILTYLLAQKEFTGVWKGFEANTQDVNSQCHYAAFKRINHKD